MEATAMMTFPTFHTITYHRDMMAMINPTYRYSLQAKKQREQNQTPQMLILVRCQAKWRQVLPSLTLLMKYQGRKTLKPSVEKQAWKRMLVTKVAQQTRQGPKRLMYDSPGNPTYVREINTGPPTVLNQVGIPLPVPYIPAPLWYAATTSDRFNSICGTHDVLEGKYDDALWDALSSSASVATMGSAISAIPVHIDNNP